MSCLVFDTWGKIQSGLFEGNQFNFGRFTECLNFRYDPNPEAGEIIQGQYCLVGFSATASTITEDDRNDNFDWREM